MRALRRPVLLCAILLVLLPGAAAAHGFWGRGWHYGRGFGFSYYRYRPFYGFTYRYWYPTYGFWGGFAYYRPWPRIYFHYGYYYPPVVVIHSDGIRDDDPPAGRVSGRDDGAARADVQQISGRERGSRRRDAFGRPY